MRVMASRDRFSLPARRARGSVEIEIAVAGATLAHCAHLEAFQILHQVEHNLAQVEFGAPPIAPPVRAGVRARVQSPRDPRHLPERNAQVEGRAQVIARGKVALITCRLAFADSTG